MGLTLAATSLLSLAALAEEAKPNVMHALEHDLRLLAFRATPVYTTPGASGVRRWDRVCLHEEVCDVYTVGTGHCVIQAATQENLSMPKVDLDSSRATVELLQSYNCRVTHVDGDAATASEEPFLAEDISPNQTVPLQLYHCPKAVPIALFLIPKCGTTSGVNWAFAMEGSVDRASLSRASEQLLNQGSTQRFLDWLTEELQLSFLVSGLPFDGDESKETLDLSAKLFNRSLYRLSFGRNARTESGPVVEHYVTPAHLCPMCCLHARGRLRVIIARNPFVRLTSYYRFRWLNLAEVSAATPRTGWSDFAPWLASVLGFRASRPELFANDLGWTPRYHDSGSCKDVPAELQPICWEARVLAIDDHDVFHLRPLGDVVRDRRHPDGVTAFQGVHIIHLETIEEDIATLEGKLCNDFGYCEKLPKFPQKVSPAGHTPSPRTMREQCLLDESTLEWFNCTAPPWLDLWSPHLADMVARAYRDDFEVLGYSKEPGLLLPLT